MKYCFRCGNSYSTKSNLNKHLRRNVQCEQKIMKISRIEIINNYNDYEDLYLQSQVSQSITNSIPEVSQSITKSIPEVSLTDDITEKINCEFCQTVFKHKNNYYRHKKYYCDKSKQNILMEEFLSTKYNLLKLEYEEKLEKQTEKIEAKLEETNKLKQELENKIKELESKMITASQINNGHIGNNIVNGDVNNVTIINNFGEEKFNITAKDCEKIMSHEFDMIVKLIEYIHIIPPENRNAFIPSLKEKYAMILKDQKWNLVDRKEFIDNLVINKNVLLEKMLDEYGTQFENVNPNRSRSVINYCKNDEEEYKRIKTSANLLLFNNKDMIRDTYEVKYNQKINSR
jgi:hypothetical protein